MKKIVFLKDFAEISSKITKKSKVLVGGCFDLLHYGHLIFLSKAKREGDFLIIVLESDEFIKMRKKRQSIHNQAQRAEILAALEFVDLVIRLPLLRSDSDYSKLINSVKPRVIAITEGDPQRKNKEQQAKEVGARIRIVTTLIEGFSSRNILKKLD